MASLLVFLLVIPLGLDLYMPVPETNPMTPAKVALGRKLFHDRRLSRTGTVACASCHGPARAFSDPRPLAVGVFGRVGRRHAPALINRGYGRAFFWDGRITTLEEQVLKPIQDPNEMDLSLDEAASRVGLSATVISQALASYLRSILSGDSPYDRFINGDRGALTAEQQRGLQIFRGRGNCTVCHVGPTFSDERFHNTGVAWQSGRLQDEGRAKGAFKTPTLREVARTAPYMHDGSVATLDEVVDFYSDGGRPNADLDAEIRPLKLTAEDKRALVRFLEALSGKLRDGAASLSPGRRAAPIASAVVSVRVIDEAQMPERVLDKALAEASRIFRDAGVRVVGSWERGRYGTILRYEVREQIHRRWRNRRSGTRHHTRGRRPAGAARLGVLRTRTGARSGIRNERCRYPRYGRRA